MWLSTFCAVLSVVGFGSGELPMLEPDAPINMAASVTGLGPTAILVVTVVTKEAGPHARVEVILPDGVSHVGGSRIPESDLTPGKPYYFRFPIRAARPGAYVIGVKVMAGEEYFRFGKSKSIAWIAQSP